VSTQPCRMLFSMPVSRAAIFWRGVDAASCTISRSRHSGCLRRRARVWVCGCGCGCVLVCLCVCVFVCVPHTHTQHSSARHDPHAAQHTPPWSLPCPHTSSHGRAPAWRAPPRSLVRC
jgi:hypothetical protein